MRVVIVHNRYHGANPSGENNVVDDEIALLRSAGVEVVPFVTDSDVIDRFSLGQKAGLALRPIYSRSAVHELADLCERLEPDIVHIHNVYPLISPQVIRVAKRWGARVVHSVHNHRLACANGAFFRDGAICTDCLDRRVGWPAIAHACYRGSRLQSSVMLGSMAVHRPTWRLVDGFFVLHEFARSFLERIGVDPQRIMLKSNMVPDHGKPVPPTRGFVFAGRLEAAKGIPLLLDAWSRTTFDGAVTLTIAGDGPLRTYVEERSRRMADVNFVGRVSRSEVLALMDAAGVAVIPSVLFEGAPLLLSEAASRGRPSVVTRVGGLQHLVGHGRGWVADPTPEGFADALETASATTTDTLVSMSARCREHYVATSSPTAVLEQLLQLYDDVCMSSRPWS